MKVRFSTRAKRRVEIVSQWWRENRSAATLFDDELSAIVERLVANPMLGFEYQVIRGKLVRRTLLPKSAQHVYYAVDDDADVIVIYTVWGARRGRAPKL